MSRKTEVVCDRCGREINGYDIKTSSGRIDFWPVGERRSMPGQRIDLCEICALKFVSFLEGEKNNDDLDTDIG